MKVGFAPLHLFEVLINLSEPGGGGEPIRVLRNPTGHQTRRRRRIHQGS
jgi:hypothetical protein